MSSHVLGIFASFQDYIREEQKVRDEINNTVKQLESSAHQMVTILQAIHQDCSETGVKASCEKARDVIEGEVKSLYKKLGDLLESYPMNPYYKYHDHWRFVTQQLAFVVSLIIFLETEDLATHEKVSETLGVQTERGTGFHLDLVDYLLGVLHLASELSRFAVTSVTYGDFKRPVQISKFVAELNAGFTLLNMKNDYLRKRFDGLKYDIKKIEEVVYDLYIRGLIKKD